MTECTVTAVAYNAIWDSPGKGKLMMPSHYNLVNQPAVLRYNC